MGGVTGAERGGVVITGDGGVVVAYDIAVPAGQGGVVDVVPGGDCTNAA